MSGQILSTGRRSTLISLPATRGFAAIARLRSPETVRAVCTVRNPATLCVILSARGSNCEEYSTVFCIIITSNFHFIQFIKFCILRAASCPVVSCSLVSTHLIEFSILSVKFLNFISGVFLFFLSIQGV